MLRAADSQQLTRRATRWGVSLGALAYFLVLFDFGLDLGRTAVSQRYASNFFDIQAQAFLRGHLSVPNGSLSIEGFVIAGHTYMYFPPFPAVLRIPFMLVTHEYDGRLTLISMGLAWIVFAIMATKLSWLVRECLRGSHPVGRTEAVVAGLLLAAVTGGTVLVFDAALPWAYHEVYLWATALAAGSLYWLVRTTLDPSRKAILWLAAFNVCLIMTRTTGGAALCAASLVVAIWVLTGRPHPGRRRTGWAILAAAVLPLAASVTYNMVKFNHPYLFPLQDQVWTQMNARRREALARNGGTITGPQFLETGIVNYLRPDGIRFTDYFPWVSLPPRPAPPYGGAFLDQSYRTGSAPAFMPFLLVTSLWGLVVTFLRRRPRFGVRALRIPLLGALIIPVGVLDYGYVTHRYTTEFVPFLVLGAMIGCCDIARLLPRLRWCPRGLVIGGLAALTAFSVLANGLTGYASARQTWGGEKLARYVQLQRELSGTVPVARSDSLPRSSRTDELRIVGNCDGLYMESGDQYEPWLTVQTRQTRVRVVIGRGALRPGELRLITADGVETRYLDLEINAHRQIRFLIVDGASISYGPWRPALGGDEIDVTLTARPELDLIQVDELPGGFVGWIPLVDFDKAWHTQIATLRQTFSSADSQAAVGVHLATGATPLPALCRELAHDAGIPLRP